MRFTAQQVYVLKQGLAALQDHYSNVDSTVTFPNNTQYTEDDFTTLYTILAEE